MVVEMVIHMVAAVAALLIFVLVEQLFQIENLLPAVVAVVDIIVVERERIMAAAAVEQLV